MPKSPVEKNLDLLFDEIKNQFRYSSDLFDNLDKKTNIMIIFISIILAVSLNGFFLKKFAQFGWPVYVSYMLSLFLIAMAILKYLFRVRRGKFSFRLIDLNSLKERYQQDPTINLQKIIGGKYINYIDENFNNYENKARDLNKAIILLRLGFIVLIITFIFVIVINKLFI